MARIRGILFDKDGTLIDFNKTWFAIGDALALEAAAGDRVEADRLMAIGGYDRSARRFRADSVFAAGANADIVALWHPDIPANRRAELTRRFDEVTAVQGAQKAVALPGMVKAAGQLHRAGYRLGVATNDSTGGAEQTVLRLGIAQLFEAIYGYDSVPHPKPAPDMIHAFCDMTGLKPAEIAMVGDNRHDLQMGRAAGAGAVVGVLSGTGTIETLTPMADVVLGSIVELEGWLKGR